MREERGSLTKDYLERSGDGSGRPSLRWLLLAALPAALVALLTVLYFDQADAGTACDAADLLEPSDCTRLHDDPAFVLLVSAIVVASLTLLACAAFLLLRRRSAETEDGEIQPEETPHGEAPLRVCPVCSAQVRTHQSVCPHCGSSYIRSRRLRARRRFGAMSRAGKLAAVAAVTLVPLFCAGASAAAILYVDDRNEESDELVAEAQAEREAEEAEQAAAEAAEEERIERELRAGMVRDLERTITKDAQKEAERSFSLIEGPVLETQCDPKGGVIDTDAVTQSFSCLAITNFTGGRARGYRYSAEINYDRFSYRWRLGGGGI